ncbi:MAG: phosphate acyltransferase PlsX [Verrucomicrobia bacterium]|nr:phosphate acyltransferase PlsX [Verrucomicrobiota bacterium]
MRLAVDVMGGDHGPEELLQGVKLGLAAEPSISCLHVVGPPDELGALLGRIGCTDPRVRIHPASEVLTMDDKPVQGLRRKKDSSILRAVELVRDGLADAVISSGNTGGIVAAATIRLRTLEGIERPTIACIMPSKSGAWVLVDGGANPECTPENLLQFGVMGSVYSRAMLGRQHPRVGVLSNGSEESKGTDLTRAAVALIRVSGLHATGYCEGYDLFMDGVDVCVCDGFVGNIVLKSAESLGKAVGAMLREELNANPWRQLGAAIARGGLRRIRSRMNPEDYGGAPLLGVCGCVLKIHGGAKRSNVRHAMGQAVRYVAADLNRALVDAIASATSAVSAAAHAAAPAQPPGSP